MSKPIIVLITLGVILAIVAMWIGVDALMCEAPCIQMTELERSMMRFRWAALGIYLLICFYDFLFVPIWYGLNRPDISAFIEIINSTPEVLVQMELMKKLTGQHSPFTLMGGGLFHLTFLSILTASVWGKKQYDRETNTIGSAYTTN